MSLVGSLDGRSLPWFSDETASSSGDELLFVAFVASLACTMYLSGVLFALSSVELLFGLGAA
jgi:hypothetical protein